jgi:hypothetical protein
MELIHQQRAGEPQTGKTLTQEIIELIHCLVHATARTSLELKRKELGIDLPNKQLIAKSKKRRQRNPIKSKEVRERLRLYEAWRSGEATRETVIQTMRNANRWNDSPDSEVIKLFGNYCRKHIKDRELKRDTNRDTFGIL